MKILIISGTHGNELSAVEAGLNLVKYYKDDTTIKVIPFLNESGLLGNSREMIDITTKDLNRSFMNDLINHSSTVEYIKDIIQDYDAVIDIHNSPRCSNFCLVDKGLNDQLICDQAGVLYATRFSTGGTIKDYVNQNEKIGITYEFSGMSTLNNSKELSYAIDDVKKLVNVLKNVNEIETTPQKANILKQMHCLETGFINFKYDINDSVAPQDVVFEVLNEYGEVIEEVKNEEETPIILIALGHTFQSRGSSVLQYIKRIK